MSLQVTLVQCTEPAGRQEHSRRAGSTLEGASDLGDWREQEWDTLSAWSKEVTRQGALGMFLEQGDHVLALGNGVGEGIAGSPG